MSELLPKPKMLKYDWQKHFNQIKICPENPAKPAAQNI